MNLCPVCNDEHTVVLSWDDDAYENIEGACPESSGGVRYPSGVPTTEPKHAASIECIELWIDGGFTWNDRGEDLADLACALFDIESYVFDGTPFYEAMSLLASNAIRPGD